MRLNRLIPATLAVAALSLLSLAAAAPAANAQALLSFSGGSGSPLSITLASPVTYTITAAPVGSSPLFVFQGVGDPFAFSFPPVTGTINFTINGGPTQGLSTANSGFSGGVVVPTDMYLFGAVPGVSVGDAVTLSAGTLTTTVNVAGAAPANGSYTTFITDGNANRLSTNGVAGGAAAPEPVSLALLALAGLPVAGLVRRRK